MFSPKYKFTHEEVRIIVLALVELKNQLVADDLLGVARLLFIMYENEVKHGVGAEQFITLYHVVEGYSDDLKTLADRI